MTAPPASPEPSTADEQGAIYYCRGCGKMGESSADLLRQGCEGTHEPYVPASRALTAEAERDEARADAADADGQANDMSRNLTRYREALERIEKIASLGGFDAPPPGDQVDAIRDLARSVFSSSQPPRSIGE